MIPFEEKLCVVFYCFVSFFVLFLGGVLAFLLFVWFLTRTYPRCYNFPTSKGGNRGHVNGKNLLMWEALVMEVLEDIVAATW